MASRELQKYAILLQKECDRNILFVYCSISSGEESNLPVDINGGITPDGEMGKLTHQNGNVLYVMQCPVKYDPLKGCE